MLTITDIKNITKIVHTEIQLETKEMKEDIAKLLEGFSVLQSSIDQVLKRKIVDDQERAVAGHRIKRLEDWVGKASTKLGISFKL